MRVLLDFSNLRAGGGLQVASATLADLASSEMQRRFGDVLGDAEIRISPAVARNLTVDSGALPGKLVVRETKPSFFAPLKPPRRSFDVRFTLFGPTYTGRLARREITGFAEVTLVYDPSEYGQSIGQQPLRQRLGNRVKRRLVRRFDWFVVEAPAIAQRLTDRFGVTSDKIFVVPNRPHPIFYDSPILEPSDLEADPQELHLAFPTRAYPHKNLELIGPAGDRFHALTGKDLRVHVTLRPEEWAGLPAGARRWMVNHGESALPDVLRIYRQVQGVFFPSKLEASSGTPLEANVLGLPLLASDRDFIRGSARPFSLFDPEDADSAARALAELDRAGPQAWVAARKHAEEYRAELAETSRTGQYLMLVQKALNDQ